MTWAALFERADRFGADLPAVHDALAGRRQPAADAGDDEEGDADE